MRRHLLFVSVLCSFVALVRFAHGVSALVNAKMLSREQLCVLFGRALAYTVKTKCAGVASTTRVRVSINQNGKLRAR